MTLFTHDHKIVTMEKSRSVSAAEFKSRCLGLLDEVRDAGVEIVVTKRGKPVARLVPVAELKPPSLRGSIVHEGDLISPVVESWDAEG